MNPTKNDTSPEIQKILIDGYSKMTPAEKIKRMTELSKAVQQLALARIKTQYGDIPEREQMLRLAALRLDRETMIRVYN